MREKVLLSNLVERFSNEMEKALHERADMGYTGWDDPCCREVIQDKLMKHVDRVVNDRNADSAVAVANLAAMLWNMPEEDDE